MTLMFSVGKWGGFYIRPGYSLRLCLGFFAVTFIPRDIDFLLQEHALYQRLLEVPGVQSAIAEYMRKGPEVKE